MFGLKRIGVACVGAVAMLGVAAPSFAGEDIPWTWNSGDHDAEAKFEAFGEHIYAKEYEGNDYVDYNPPGTGGAQRWYIPGSEDATRKDNDLAYAEGLRFTMQVCETKTLAPDDCSEWKQGVT